MISQRRDGDVAVLTIDDGKANAMGVEFFGELDGALDATDAPAVVIAGRAGMFSAGLDRKVVEARGQALHDLLVAFGRTTMRLWLEPRPVVVAATGHAVAAGTILAMAADHAVADEDEGYRWGLVEVTLGVPLPRWVITLARANVRADRLDDLLLRGAVVSPATAVEAGFADVAVDGGEVLPAALGRARELAALPAPAYAETKRRLRAAAAGAALEALEQDTADLLAVAR